MRRVAVCILCIALTIFFISACAGPTRVEKNFGKSVKQAWMNQILNPDAQKNLEPVTGLDGKAANAGIEGYRMTFERFRAGGQPSTPFVDIGTQVGKPIQGSGLNK